MIVVVFLRFPLTKQNLASLFWDARVMWEIWSRQSKNLPTIEFVETYEMRNLKCWGDGICQKKETQGQMLVAGRGLKFGLPKGPEACPGFL